MRRAQTPSSTSARRGLPRGVLTLTLIVTSLLAITEGAGAQPGVPTAWTYQGRLDVNAAPANGQYELRFGVYATTTAGPELGGSQSPM